jgi:hypothetical protein
MAVDRSRLARFVARNLQELPKGAGWSTALRSDGDDTLTEGDYTDSIDFALRSLGFVDETTGLPDETLADEASFDALADIAEGNALDRLRNFYMSAVDTVGGPVRIYRSQIAQALQRRQGGSGRRLVRSRLGTSALSVLLED